MAFLLLLLLLACPLAPLRCEAEPALERGAPADFRGRPRLLPLALPAPAADFFVEELFNVVGMRPFWTVDRGDHGEPGAKLRREPAALSRPFLSVSMTAKLGLASSCASLPLCREVWAVRSESMLLSGLEGLLGLPELETRIV